MRVYVYPVDSYGVGHYRGVWPAEVVHTAGWADVSILPPRADTDIGGVVDEDGHVAWADCPRDADVLVFQRITDARIVEAIPFLQRRGVAVVVDVDDDLTCIHPRNPAFHAHHPRRNARNNFNWLGKACAAANLVTCSTPELARKFGGHGRAVVLENCVPARYLDIPRVDEAGEEPTAGWAGSMHSHPGDLQVVGNGVRQSGLRFRVVGPPAGVGRVLHLGEVEGTGPVMFGDWPFEVAKLDVGIAPLADTRFNRAKSWLKPLEYAALGVPFVASPTPEYQRFVQAVGLQAIMVSLALRPRDWAASLKMLRNPKIRAQLSEAGRATVRDRLTYEGQGWRWAEAWELARKGI